MHVRPIQVFTPVPGQPTEVRQVEGDRPIDPSKLASSITTRRECQSIVTEKLVRGRLAIATADQLAWVSGRLFFRGESFRRNLLCLGKYDPNGTFEECEKHRVGVFPGDFRRKSSDCDRLNPGDD